VVKRGSDLADIESVAPANRLQALLDLSHRLSSSLDLNDVLREFSERAVELTGATAAEISRWKRDENDLVMLVEYLEGKDEITVGGGQSYPLGEYPATKFVLETQQPRQIRVSDPTADPAERALLERRGQKSLLMLPLVARGETIGLMEIIDTVDREFDEADVDFCRALCDVVATAVRNAMLYSEVEELAARDRLTGLYNRRLFEEQLEVAVARSARTGEELSLLVVDVDGLKRINDLGGHPAGDNALYALAEALRTSTRATDVCCRLGGDEFAVILPASGSDAALRVAERAQERLAELGRGQYSFSGGVARYVEAHSGAYDVYRAADIAAYRAKAAGGARTLMGIETPMQFETA
jgi:diguanylate cyclase (GGDEF)-like protein